MKHFAWIGWIAVASVLVSAGVCPAGEEEDGSSVVRPQAYRRLTLTLPKAIEGNDVVLHLGVQDGTVSQAWGEVPGNRRLVQVYGRDKAQYEDGRLRGTLRCRVKLDRYSHTYICLVDLDGRLRGKQIAGDFETRTSVLTKTVVYGSDDLRVKPGEASLFHYGRELEGKVSGRMLAHVSKDTADFTLWTRHLLEGHASWTRYLTMGVTVKDGKVAKVSIAPSNGPRAGWKADRIDHELSWDGEELSGTVTMETKGAGGAMFGGTYHMKLNAKVEHGVVKGKITATRNGKKYSQENQLSGVADGGSADSRANAVFALHIRNAIEAVRDLRIHIDRRGGKIVEALAFVPEYPEWYDVKVAKGGGGGGAFAGELAVQFPEKTYMTSTVKALAVTYKLNLKGTPAKMAGTWACEFGEYARREGKLVGSLDDLEGVRKRNAIRKGFDWPCWNGPMSCFAASPGGHKLVDRLEDARHVWMSERTYPARCQTKRYGESNVRRYLQRGIGSGGASPIVHDGKVFFSYFQPAEGPTAEEYVQSEVAKGRHVMPIMFATNGKDVAVCLDAATGETLWRKVIPGGRYFAMNGRQGSTKGWYTTNPAAKDGVFFFGTSSDTEYAVDGRTGKTIWNRTLGPTSGRVTIGDVMVRAESHLRGYDVKTGRTRWTVKDAGASYALPARWKRGGEEYIIVANSAGEVRCVRPSDGKVLWTETGAGNNGLSVSVRGDYLLCNGRKARKAPGELTCYRIGLQGAKRLWAIPSSTFHYRPKAAPAAMTDEYAFIRTRGPEGLAVVRLKDGEIVSFPKHGLGASGYVQWMDGRVSLQPDASHSKTPLLWFDVTNPEKTTPLGDLWRTRHRTTSSYYPILISHPMADGRIFIRGGSGIHCYDLRKKDHRGNGK